MKFANYMKTMVPAMFLLMTGCQEDDIRVNTDSTRDIQIAAPAGEIKYNISDFIEDLDNDYVFIDEDGLVYVSYSQDVDIDWESLVLLHDYSNSWHYSPLGILPASPLKAAVQVSFSEKVKLNPNEDIRYDSLSMKSGVLAAQLSVPYGTLGQITVSLPEIEKNGSPLEYSFIADQYNNTFNIYEDLQGLRVEPSHGQDSSYISVITTLGLNSVAIGDVGLDFSLTSMMPGMAFGYFGKQESSKIDQELNLDVFDDLDLADQITFHDFAINLEVTNGIGVPFDVNVRDVEFYNEYGQLTNTLSVDGKPKVNLSLDAAKYGNPVQTSTATFGVNRDNSNIVEIGNSYPRKLIFDITSGSNPNGETDEPNFMGVDNILKGKLNVVMPAWFSINKEYFRTDTVDFDIHDILDNHEDDARGLDSSVVNFDFYSKIPVDIAAAAWVIDDDGNIIDYLLESKISVIAAGEPDPETGRVKEAKHTNFKVTISGDQVDKFLDRNAVEIVLGTYFQTVDENDEGIKIYDDMDLRAVLSFNASGKMPSF
jgi:hypothetical protein